MHHAAHFLQCSYVLACHAAGNSTYILKLVPDFWQHMPTVSKSVYYKKIFLSLSAFCLMNDARKIITTTAKSSGI
jgi:hypothetical protein